MHQNHYFLKKLSLHLDKKISGFRVSESFTQNKNEHILLLTNGEIVFTIKTHLGSSFCCLSFPEKFARKKTNSVNLFPRINSLKIIQIGVFNNERALFITFQNDLSLVFQMFGNRSNVFLYKGNECIEAFRKKHSEINRSMESFHRKLPLSTEAESGILAMYPTIAGLPLKILKLRGFDLLDSKKQIDALKEMSEELNSSQTYYLIRFLGKLKLSLIPEGEIQEKFDDPEKAITFFFNFLIRETHLKKEKSQKSNELKKQIAKTANYIHKSENKIRSLTQELNHQQTGDLIMANLGNIKLHNTSVTVENFYTGKEIVIKLNPELSPQRNAEKYYRKAKKQSIELDNLSKNIEAKNKLYLELITRLEAVEKVEDIKSLRNIVGYKKKVKKGHDESTPFYQKEFKNYKILIGKGARQNDSLLKLFSWKEDIWLHIKDGPGSHVLIKHQAGANIPMRVIEYAAQLAAYYSKRKHDSLTPVIYTPRKFVRKRKGDPAGMVVVEKEKVLLVEPWRHS